jgi:hypothetical protein
VKRSLLLPILCSLLLCAFMLSPHYGFSDFINHLVSSLDYYFTWSVSPIDAALVAIIPWIVYRLPETEEKRSVKNQLGLSLLFLVSALVFFTFGFLLIPMGNDANPLLPQYIKMQPFASYWAIWFALGNVLVTVFYFINKRQIS